MDEELQRNRSPEFMLHAGVLLLVCGIMTFPAIFVAKFFGFERGIVAATVAPLLIAVNVGRTIWKSKVGIVEYFTTTHAVDLDDKGRIAFVLGGVPFVAAAIFLCWTSQHPSEEMAAAGDAVSMLFLGLTFFLLGSGSVLIGLAHLLGKWIFQRTLKEIDNRILLQPGNPAALLQKAAQCIERDQYKRALEALTQAIEIDPNHAESFVRRGEVHYLKDRFDEAIADFSRAIELDPNCLEAYMFRHMIYDEKGKSDLAKQDQAIIDQL
jgi:hypothetical protein